MSENNDARTIQLGEENEKQNVENIPGQWNDIRNNGDTKPPELDGDDFNQNFIPGIESNDNKPDKSHN